MLLSCNWLADYVDLPEDREELARRLTDAGHAVEGIEEIAGEDGTKDVVFDVDITTNRSDCMNHFGMAREIAVLLDQPLKAPAVELEESSEEAAAAAGIEIEAPDLCRRYVGRVIRGVKIGPSPQWLRNRLEAIGLRPINNVVDVSNYVLWEYGQPLHAFDLAKLGGARIKVRLAQEGERLTTLDGEERQLDSSMLIIADEEVPVALAGVMGGLDSEVTDETSDVLIESAFFETGSVRRTAGILGMHTDASHRFERGADPEICAVAARRAAALITELAGGTNLAGDVDVYPNPRPPREVPLSLPRLQAFAGAEIPRDDVERWLTGLGFVLEAPGEDGWQVTVPSWRYLDVERPADLYEEAVRIYGFDRIEATLPALSGHDGGEAPGYHRASRLREELAALGYAEVIDFAFHDAEADERYPGLLENRGALVIENALSERYAVMRRSLLPGLLASAGFNQRRGAPVVRLFEVAHVFGAKDSGEGLEGVEEIETVGLVAGGTLGHPWDDGRDLDFFDLKGAIEHLVAASGPGGGFEWRAEARPELVEGCAAGLYRHGRRLGYAGQAAGHDGPYPLFVAEIEAEAFTAAGESGPVTVPSRFPGIQVDLTLTHALETPWASLRQAVDELALTDLSAFGLKVRYRGKGVPEGAVNTTVYFEFSSTEGSLTHEDVNERLAAAKERLESRFGWKQPS